MLRRAGRGSGQTTKSEVNKLQSQQKNGRLSASLIFSSQKLFHKHRVFSTREILSCWHDTHTLTLTHTAQLALCMRLSLPFAPLFLCPCSCRCCCCSPSSSRIYVRFRGIPTIKSAPYTREPDSPNVHRRTHERKHIRAYGSSTKIAFLDVHACNTQNNKKKNLIHKIIIYSADTFINI